jgi:hypothetical protein
MNRKQSFLLHTYSKTIIIIMPRTDLQVAAAFTLLRVNDNKTAVSLSAGCAISGTYCRFEDCNL